MTQIGIFAYTYANDHAAAMVSVTELVKQGHEGIRKSC
jgi:hypothetical protein